MIKKKKYYVYIHSYNNQPVYIGKGSVSYIRQELKGGYDARAYNLSHRNEKYTNFIKEVGKENIEVKIVARFDDEQDALWLEEELHSIYEGLYSVIVSKAMSGEKNPMYGKNPLEGKSEEEKNEIRKKQSVSHKGKIISEKQRKITSKRSLGNQYSAKKSICVFDGEVIIKNSVTQMCEYFKSIGIKGVSHWYKGKIPNKYKDRIEYCGSYENYINEIA